MKMRRLLAMATLLLTLLWGGDALAFYNPSTGRWLNRDPIAESRDLDLYSFAGNAPINKYDRLGLLALSCGQCDAACKEVKDKKNQDRYIKQITEFLTGQSCAYDFKCVEGEACDKQTPPLGGRADANVSDRNYGPNKGTCTVRLCASKIDAGDLTTVLRHELAHCAMLCSGTPNDTCSRQLCHEVYALAVDGRCGPPSGASYLDCIKSNAKSSSGRLPVCKDVDMDAILTDAFIESCRHGRVPK
jgi:hypothetical protein